jgi:Protein of unknown function DUF2617
MNLLIERPSVKETFFCLYARPLHPELFDVLASRRVDRDDWTLSACITPAGHVLTWSSGAVCLTETVASIDHALPNKGKLIRHRFEGERRGTIQPIAGVSYRMISQIEILPPEIFLHVHEEILADGLKRGLLHRHCPHNRLALSPLGFIVVESWKNTLSINTFHTFPFDYAVVKTQSLIER